MKPIAIIQTQSYDIDTIILWDDGARLVAFAYQDGRVKQTRPLEADTANPAAQEALDGFSIGHGELAIIADIASRQVAILADRWH